jgi:hypothetical protein
MTIGIKIYAEVPPFRLTILVRAPHNIHCTTALPSRWMVIQEKGVAIFALPLIVVSSWCYETTVKK